MLPLLLLKNPKLILLALHALAGILGIVILSLTLGSCTSTSPYIPDIYLLRISSNVTKSAEARLGYLGLCVLTNGSLKCASKAGLVHLLAETKSPSPFFSTAMQLLDHVFTVTFEAISTGLFVVGVLMAVWHLFRVKQTGKLAAIICACFAGSAAAQLLGFIAFWYATHALEYSSSEEVVMQRGVSMFWFHIFMVFYPIVLMLPNCWAWIKVKFRGSRANNKSGMV